MLDHNIVDSPAVREDADRLPLRAGDSAEGVTSGVKD